MNCIEAIQSELLVCFSAGPKNGTVRFDQEEAMKEGNKSNPIHDYLIPERLTVMREPFGANETVPFLMQPKLVMVDKLNRTVKSLGHGEQGRWYDACLANVLTFQFLFFTRIYTGACHQANLKRTFKINSDPFLNPKDENLH